MEPPLRLAVLFVKLELVMLPIFPSHSTAPPSPVLIPLSYGVIFIQYILSSTSSGFDVPFAVLFMKLELDIPPSVPYQYTAPALRFA